MGVRAPREVSGPPIEPVDDEAHLVGSLFALEREAPDIAVLLVRRGDAFITVTAAEVARQVRRIARGLIVSGVAPGDRVALMSSSRPEWLIADLSIVAAGAITVPIYDTSSADQIEWILSDSGAVVALVETIAMGDSTRGRMDATPDCREVLVIDDGALEELEARGDQADGAEFPSDVVDRRVEAMRADDLATIIYTSGTTGRPKGCMLTHRNLLTNVEQTHRALADALEPDEVSMVFLPLAHVLTKGYVLFGLVQRMTAAFATDLEHLPEELPMARPTVMAAVPRIFEKVYEGARHRAREQGRGRIFDAAADLAVRWSRQRTVGRIRPTTAAAHWVFERLVYRKVRAAFGGRLRFAFSGGGPLGDRLTHFYAGIGLDVYEGYGLTETSPTLTINRPGAWKPGTVGQPLAGTSIRIAPDGEIQVRGPQVFPGYWRNPEATDASFQDGWFCTGDIGELDDERYLRITGRKKELIVTAAGKNVAPAPLEDRLRAHPLISQAVVVGEGRPFISAMVTIDEVGLERWLAERQRPAGPAAQLSEDGELRAEIQRAVNGANDSVSRAESIREFAILPVDLTIESGELTPTLKVKRAVVERTYADTIDSIYRAPV